MHVLPARGRDARERNDERVLRSMCRQLPSPNCTPQAAMLPRSRWELGVGHWEFRSQSPKTQAQDDLDWDLRVEVQVREQLGYSHRVQALEKPRCRVPIEPRIRVSMQRKKRSRDARAKAGTLNTG